MQNNCNLAWIHHFIQPNSVLLFYYFALWGSFIGYLNVVYISGWPFIFFDPEASYEFLYSL